MIKISGWITLTITLACSVNCSAGENEPRRVFFLGNSVFYSRGGLCPSFEGFCHAAGLDYQAYSQWNTPDNSLGVDFLDYGRIPLNLPKVSADGKIHDLIRSGSYDYVILEARRPGYLLPESVSLPEEYGKPVPYEKNLDALRSLHRTIVESGAQTVLYMHPGSYETPGIHHLVAQVYLKLHSDLENTEINGRKHKVILVPASMMWLDAVDHFGVENWYADPSHGNGLARYASACMLYTYLTGKDPRENNFTRIIELSGAWDILPGNENLFAGEEEAAWIKNQVWLYYSTKPR